MASTALSITPWSTASAMRSASVLCPEATIAISRLVTRPAVSQRERHLVDQRVHRVVRVEVGVEDEVRRVAGLDDERTWRR